MSQLKNENRAIYGDVITDTQRASWDETQQVMGVQDSKVLGAIIQSGGLCNFEICSIVGRPAHGVSGSISRLRERGLIFDSGERKPNPNSNKSQIVWRQSQDSKAIYDESGQRLLFDGL